MLEMRKNSTSKMSCIQQQSHQSQHGLKNSFKISLLKKSYKRCELVKILKLYKHDIRPCLYVFIENEVQFHFSHFSCNFLSKHYIVGRAIVAIYGKYFISPGRYGISLASMISESSE